MCTLLTGKSLEWATAVWKEDGTVFPSFHNFLTQFRSVFEHTAGGESAEENLLNITQGNRTAADYALAFRTLAAQAGWEEKTLKLLYRRGLNHELQTELACRDEERDLLDFIKLSIQIGNLIRAHRSPTQVIPAETAEPMHLGYTHLMPEETEHRLNNQLCLYCGRPDHLLPTCPTRLPNRRNIMVSSNIFTSHSLSCV